MSAVQSKPSIYEAITIKIVAAIEAGSGTYTMPWHGAVVPVSIPVNTATKNPYRGVNIVALWASAALKGYPSGHWASYRQWQNLGAQVRRGERGSSIVFYKKLETDDANDEAPRFVARASTVFNAAQVDAYKSPPSTFFSIPERIEAVEAFVQATRADIRHGGMVARYRHDQDCIEMPDRSSFTGTTSISPTEAYYAVLCHEIVHWSGAPHRLNRQFGTRFGDRAYAFEELIAELGAAFLCSSLGITNEPRDDHAAYISHWLDILDRDNRSIFTAASQAQEAVRYLRTLAASNDG